MTHETARTKVQELKKHPQFILAIDNTYFVDHNDLKPSEFGIGISNYNVAVFADEVQSYLSVREREYLDNATNGKEVDSKGSPLMGDRNYRQPIPYMLISRQGTPARKEYLLYRRTAKTGDTRLADKYSVGSGGHIDAKQVVWEQSKNNGTQIDLLATLLNGASVEQHEELRPADPTRTVEWGRLVSSTTNKFIYLDQSPVDQLHIGIVMELIVPADMGITENEPDLSVVGFFGASEILDLHVDLENWSRILLESIVLEERRTAIASQVQHQGIDTYRYSDDSRTAYVADPTVSETGIENSAVHGGLAFANVIATPPLRQILKLKIPDGMTVEEGQVYVNGATHALSLMSSNIEVQAD